jgi:broad specificity phosphatase PhoE
MFNRKCKITFISHGSTIYSEENRFSDNEHYPPINEAGEEEIKKICEWLKKRAIKTDKIYSSPALRTIQSSEIVAKALKKDFQIINNLYSKKCGRLSGLTFEQIKQKYPEMFNEFRENPRYCCPEADETILEFNKKNSKIIKNIVEENIGNRIIIITHPEVIQSVIGQAIKLSPKHQCKIYIRTGSASQISYFEDWASLVYSGYIPL